MSAAITTVAKVWGRNGAGRQVLGLVLRFMTKFEISETHPQTRRCDRRGGAIEPHTQCRCQRLSRADGWSQVCVCRAGELTDVRGGPLVALRCPYPASTVARVKQPSHSESVSTQVIRRRARVVGQCRLSVLAVRTAALQ
jgi:hypothetical protein